MTATALPLPLLSTQGRIVLIDDDAGFLATLEGMLSGEHRVTAFTEPAALHRFLAGRIDLLAAERMALAELWRAQAETRGTVAVQALRFFARPERFDTPLVLVSDYAMPLETGVSVCSRYANTGLRRVLLTGVADSTVAVKAFNAGAIDQFVEKQGSRFPASVLEALQRQLAASAAARAASLADRIAPELTAALASPEATKALRALLARLDVQEHLLLGEPQGLLAIARGGRPLWIQLETQASLGALQDVLELAQLPLALRQRVRERQALVAMEWMQQLGAPAGEAQAIVLGSAPLLLAAVFPLELAADLRPATPPGAR